MLRHFLTWWLGQLTELLPPAWRRYGTRAGEAVLVTPVEPIAAGVRRIAISRRRNRSETPVGRFDLSAAGRDPMGIDHAGLDRAGLDRNGSGNREISTLSAAGATILCLDASETLAKVVTLPVAAERDLDQVLTFEMDRETPFTAEELYWTYHVEARDRQNGRFSIRLLMVPRARLAVLLAALERIGLVPDEAEIVGGPDAGSRLWLGSGRHGRYRRSSVPFRMASAACVVLLVAAVAIPFVRQSVALAALDRRIAAERPAAAEAESLRRRIGDLSGSRDLVATEQARAGRPLEIIAAATRILPDDTYLTELSLRQRRVTLTGQSAGAARLIGAIAGDGVLRNPEFAAPVTRLPSGRLELFTLNAEARP